MENILESDSDILSTIVSYEMSRRGLGPKLYGVFSGGIIQEYIDSHTLTCEESIDPVIYRDVAISIAHVHSIEGLPLKMSGNIPKPDDLMKIPIDKIEYWKRHEGIKKFNLDLNLMLSFDFLKEMEYLRMKCNEVKMRKNLILYDMNYGNILVHNHSKANGRKVVLIDYDAAHYGYRGIDIGSFFFHRSANNCMDPKIHTPRFFTLNEKRKFLNIYQQEIKRLNIWKDFDENGIDSIENLLLESIIGICIGILDISFWFMKSPETYLDDHPEYSLYVEFSLKSFSSFKNQIDGVCN